MSRHRTQGLQLACLGALLALFGLVGTARASDESLAVLGIEAIEVSDAAGTELTEALRRKAAETPGVRLVPGKDLIELKMVFGCDGEAPACLAQAGRTLGADRLIYGTVKKEVGGKKADAGKNIVVSLKLLDVRDLAVVKQITETLPKRSFTGAAITAAAARWFGQLVVPPQNGIIAVQSQPADALVLVDGAPSGRTPLKLKDVRPGSHTVALQLDGHQATSQTVEVSAGAIASLFIKLEREARPEPVRTPTVGVIEPPPVTSALTDEPVKPRHPGRGAKIAAIGLVAGAVVAGAVAIYTWRTYLKLENSARSDLEQLVPPNSSMLGEDAKGFFRNPQCSTPPVSASGARDSYLSNCESGNKYADATTGLWISAGVLATAGIVSFIVGDRLDAKAEKEHRNKQRGIQQSLRLLPAISTQGGGLQASFEF